MAWAYGMGIAWHIMAIALTGSKCLNRVQLTLPHKFECEFTPPVKCSRTPRESSITEESHERLLVPQALGQDTVIIPGGVL